VTTLCHHDPALLTVKAGDTISGLHVGCNRVLTQQVRYSGSSSTPRYWVVLCDAAPGDVCDLILTCPLPSGSL
jgi:hypothetical protein